MIRTALWTVILAAPLALGQAKAAPSGEAATTPTAQPDKQQYVIGPEDVVSVNVWKEPDVSRVVPVRPDGKIALPLAGEFQAAGLTATQLESEITKKLLTLIQNPQVTVIVQEIRSQKFNVVGEVKRPGSYSFQGEMTVLDAIALAGGLSDFAKPKKMYLLRVDADGRQTRIPVNYKDVVAGKPNTNVKVLAKDTLVVP